MDLELKYLAPYLPYGVQFIGKRVDFAHSDVYSMTLCAVDLDGRFEWIKPILRPMYDLNAGILIAVSNGMLDISMGADLSYNIEDSESYYPSGSYEIHKDMWLGNYEILLKNHFDVFSLIDRGLAIDINTFKQA